MLTLINPATVPPSQSRYSQAVLVGPGARWLHVSGQLGITADGTVLTTGFEAQMRHAMSNLFAVLEAADMAPSDIVKVTVLSTANDGQTVEAYRRVRDELLGDHAPAALFASVTGFTQPDFLVEIEAVAAAAP